MSSDLQSILSLEVPVIVVLGERQMKVSDVCALSPGAILELPSRAEDELTLQVNNKPMGTGVAVKVGENFGIRITYIGDLKSRIAALGQGVSISGALPSSADNDLAALAEAMLSGQA